MKRVALAAVVLAACGPTRAPRTLSEEERVMLVHAGTAPPEPGREQWGASSGSSAPATSHDALPLADTASSTHDPAPATSDAAASGTTLTGRASYYSDRLAGHRTASGEPYDPSALTAASRDLPLGTRLRVTRVQTGATVIVRVNDRGPFGDHARILDLSRAAATQLDMLRSGVVDVTAEILPAE